MTYAASIRHRVVFCGALVASILATTPAYADDPHIQINEVRVTFGNANTITIKGEHFQRKGAILSVNLGEQGPLPILSSSPNEIVAECFVDKNPDADFDCEAGDYVLGRSRSVES
jgi:hypothetical protein